MHILVTSEPAWIRLLIEVPVIIQLYIYIYIHIIYIYIYFFFFLQPAQGQPRNNLQSLRRDCFETLETVLRLFRTL